MLAPELWGTEEYLSLICKCVFIPFSEVLQDFLRLSVLDGVLDSFVEGAIEGEARHRVLGQACVPRGCWGSQGNWAWAWFWVRGTADRAEFSASEFADYGKGCRGVPLCASEEADEGSEEAVPGPVYLPDPVPFYFPS